jgi:hypothetical protein
MTYLRHILSRLFRRSYGPAISYEYWVAIKREMEGVDES